MFRIIKIVSLPQGQSAEFYLTQLGYWVQDVKNAANFGELAAIGKVEQFNKKADKHYCNNMLGKFQITTYLMEEI